MKKTSETVYRCDFCNKAIVSKGFMTLHERMCKKNPKNQHKCFDFCEHLIKEFDHETGETSFYCNVTKLDLYSYKLERFKSNSQRIEGLTRMPLECEHYSDKQVVPSNEINDFWT